MGDLTQDDRAQLLRPFTADAVKFRIDGKPRNGKVRCLTYIDSRLAVERLTDVDPNWESEYGFPGGHPGDPLGTAQNLPVLCRLKVKGIVREGAGQVSSAKVDEKHFKSAVSDALKRAAVDFGVGAYLYTLGNTFVEVGKHTTADGKYLTAAGQRYLRDQYRKAIAGKAFVERFGTPVDYGDRVTDDALEAVEDTTPEPTRLLDGRQAGILAAFAPPEARDAWASRFAQRKAEAWESSLDGALDHAKATHGWDEERVAAVRTVLLHEDATADTVLELLAAEPVEGAA